MRSAEVVVIGGGVIGCSIAYHLVRAGKRDVLLLEKGMALATGTTPQAAGLCGQLRSSAVMTRLMQYCIEVFKGLEKETGQSPDFRQVGSLRLALTPEREEELRRHVGFGRQHGLDIDFISPAEARRLVPGLDTTGVRLMTYIPTDGFIDPYSVTIAFARGARDGGAKFLLETPATGLVRRDGRVEAVQTTAGPVRADWVVDAAGAWAELLGESAGVRIPQFPVRHQLWVTAPLPDVRRDQPVVRIPDAWAYIRPEVDGLLVGFFEPTPKSFDIRQFPPEFEIARLEQDWQVLATYADGPARQFPSLRGAGITRGCAGLPTLTPDGRLNIGPAPGLRNLLVASGCNVHGIMTSPAFGRLITELIVEGRASVDISGMAVDRFGDQYPTGESLRKAAETTYAGYYALSPGYR